VKRLTAGNFNDTSPTFSPDGSLIAFTRNKIYNWGGLAANWGSDGVLCVMKADGSKLWELTGEEFMAGTPQFSRDGKTIFCSSADGMYAVHVDGSKPPRPLEHLRVKAAVYSPDERLVTFSMGGKYSGEQRIFVANADGTGRKRFPSPGEGQDRSIGEGCFSPAFTPDCKRIIFFLERWPEGPTGLPKKSLWEVEIEGTNPREIASYGLFDDPLNWRPNPPIPTKEP
jgi:Tol biopolymer transport system component